MYEDVNEPLGRPLDEAADRVAALEMAFVEMLAKCSWAKREQWCGAIDCHCVLARRALRHGPLRRRPDPTPDMVEKTNVDSVGFALLDRNDGFPRSRLHPQT
jgi:hypothetical protein